MLPEAPRRAASIRERGELYRQQGFPRTGKLLLELAQVVETGQDDKRQSVYDQIAPIYRQEYSGADRDFLALHDFIDGIIDAAIRANRTGFSQKLLELSPLITSMGKAATVMGKLASLFLGAGHLPDEQRYYAACLIHALDIEGQFDEACRLLYVLFKFSLGENVTLDEARALHVRQIRDRMRQPTNDSSEILFLGWQEGHLRNCVAHMRFEYNAINDTMHFVDVNNSGVETYNRTSSYNEFAKFYHLANGVSLVFLHATMMLGAHDMAFAPNPF